MIICEYKDCTGCSACLNTCNHSAITMQEGTNGHYFPSINPEKCVECGMCYRACPNNIQINYRYPLSAYISTAASQEESIRSTSAGIASVLSRSIINQGGVVYGCCGEDCECVKHIRIEKEEDIERLKGSKYVQSSIGVILQQLKRDLREHKKVLFIGTPCQVSGVYGYLGKAVENLFTVDLICHGVPSQKLLTDALSDYTHLDNLHGLNVTFREKKKGKSFYGLYVRDFKGKSIYQSKFPYNDYITGFLTGLFYRESCYDCKYARAERVSDITIGDYWDKEALISLPNKGNGLSMLIVNSPRGQELLEFSKCMLHLTPGDYSSFVQRNGQLSHPIKKSDRYEDFKTDYPRFGFHKAAKKHLRKQKLIIRRNMLANRIKGLIHACLAGIGVGNKK